MKLFSTILLLLSTVVPAVFSQTFAPAVSVLDMAADDGNYSTVLNAIRNTPGVLEALAANIPITIFAPTNGAFSDIAAAVNALDQAALANVLAGHVVKGVYSAQDVINAGCVELTTLAGTQLSVSAYKGRVYVNDAKVIQADIQGMGGIIHGVNTVILPGTFHPCRGSRGHKRGKRGYGYGSTSSSKSTKRSSAYRPAPVPAPVPVPVAAPVAPAPVYVPPPPQSKSSKRRLI